MYPKLPASKKAKQQTKMYGSREPMCEMSLSLSDLDNFDVLLFQIQISHNYFPDLLPGCIGSSKLCKKKGKKNIIFASGMCIN